MLCSKLNGIDQGPLAYLAQALCCECCGHGGFVLEKVAEQGKEGGYLLLSL